MRIRNDHEENFELPLVPMIDMMLVLLIFFMVATTLKTQKPEVPVKLPPSAASLSAKEDAKILVITVDPDGRKYIDGLATTNEALRRRLHDAAGKNPDQPIEMRVDRSAHFDQVVEVLDLCAFEGLKNVGFHTRSPKE